MSFCERQKDFFKFKEKRKLVRKLKYEKRKIFSRFFSKERLILPSTAVQSKRVENWKSQVWVGRAFILIAYESWNTLYNAWASFCSVERRKFDKWNFHWKEKQPSGELAWLIMCAQRFTLTFYELLNLCLTKQTPLDRNRREWFWLRWNYSLMNLNLACSTFQPLVHFFKSLIRAQTSRLIFVCQEQRKRLARII